MIDDAELLRRFAREGAEEAFGEIVRRYVDLVYSAALRQVGGDAHHAKDVAQRVFTDLARKAESVARRPVLAGWLFTATRFAAAKIVRGEQRRRAREQEVAVMSDLLDGDVETSLPLDWERLRPVIDEAMSALKEGDREAVLLRFFENRGLAEVGARLGLSENAARMRVERALEKLRVVLGRRGVTSTSAALGTVLANQAVAAAPAGIAGAVASAAAASAAVTGVAAFFSFMALTKTSLGLAATVLIAAGLGVAWQQAENGRKLAANDVSANRIGILEAEIRTARTVEKDAEAKLQRMLSRSEKEARVLADVLPDPVFSDPEHARLYKLWRRSGVGSPRLFRRLELNPRQVDQLIDLMLERQLAADAATNMARKVMRVAGLSSEQAARLADDAEFKRQTIDLAVEKIDQRMRSFLGDARYALFLEMTDRSQKRWVADDFADAAALRGVTVADEQVDALRRMFVADTAVNSEDAENQMAVWSERVLSEAAAVLNPAQLAALRKFRERKVAEQALQEMNRVAAGQGLLNLDPEKAARYRAAASADGAGVLEGGAK